MRKNCKFISVFISLLMIFILFSGCGSKNGNTTSNISKNGTNSEQTQGITSETKQKEDSKNVAVKPLQNQVIHSNRKIIKASDINLNTKNFDNTISSINNEVSKLNGYIESSNVDGSKDFDSNTHTAKFSIKIPKDNFDTFIESIGDYGQIINKSISGKDVTDEYFDTEAHLKSLQVQESRMLELLKTSSDLKTILDIEKELANVRYQIETLTGTLKKYDNLVDYSTVTINVQEVKNYTKTKASLWGNITKTFASSINILVKILKGILIGTTALLPFIPPFIVVILLYKIIKKKKAKK